MVSDWLTANCEIVISTECRHNPDMKNHTHPYTKHDLLVEVPSLGVVRDIGKEGVRNMTLQLLLNQVRCQQNLDIYPYPKYGSTLC